MTSTATQPTRGAGKALTLLVLGAAAFVAAPAAAQYQWRDGEGRMVFSDLPPPASVDPKRILHAPKPPVPTEAARDAAGAGAARQAADGPAAGRPEASAPSTIQANADGELAYRKRQADQMEQEKKALEASRRKSEIAQACSDSRGDIRTLESGQRIGRIDAAGEREYLSDAERSERLKAARKNVGENC